MCAEGEEVEGHEEELVASTEDEQRELGNELVRCKGIDKGGAYGIVVIVPENTADFACYGFVGFRACDERAEKGDVMFKKAYQDVRRRTHLYMCI